MDTNILRGTSIYCLKCVTEFETVFRGLIFWRFESRQIKKKEFYGNKMTDS